MFYKIISILLLTLVSSCINGRKITLITDLPKQLSENSGMVSYNKESAWLIEDGGNADKLYKVNYKGIITKTLEVKGAKNKDWEDLTKDKKGNVYIGDIGNNESKRKDLVVYKIPNPELAKGDKIEAEKIKFYYPEQKKFPPKKKHLYYDAESLFYKNDFLYIITKNRSHPFNGEAFIYKIPAKKGTHKAILVDTINLCQDWNSCQITSADVSPNGKKIALLSYGKLFIITDFKQDNFSKGTIKTIDLKKATQLESVCFIDENNLLLSDEKKGDTGRKLYSFSLN